MVFWHWWRAHTTLTNSQPILQQYGDKEKIKYFPKNTFITLEIFYNILQMRELQIFTKWESSQTKNFQLACTTRAWPSKASKAFTHWSFTFHNLIRNAHMPFLNRHLPLKKLQLPFNKKLISHHNTTKHPTNIKCMIYPQSSIIPPTQSPQPSRSPLHNIHNLLEVHYTISTTF